MTSDGLPSLVERDVHGEEPRAVGGQQGARLQVGAETDEVLVGQLGVQPVAGRAAPTGSVAARWAPAPASGVRPGGVELGAGGARRRPPRSGPGTRRGRTGTPGCRRSRPRRSPAGSRPARARSEADFPCQSGQEPGPEGVADPRRVGHPLLAGPVTSIGGHAPTFDPSPVLAEGGDPDGHPVEHVVGATNRSAARSGPTRTRC